MTAANAGEAERAVLAATERWLAGTVAADAEALDLLLTPGYVFTHATTAAADTREEWLGSFRSGARRYRVWQIADVALQSFPGSVVMTGRGHQEIVRPSGEIVELNTRFLNVWVEQDGHWRCAAWQATRIPDPS
jgi:ketosteroid isomerase-like protein